jgi:hypothetical protein
MSREEDVLDLLDSDAPLLAVLTGGIYAYGDTGLDGITRENTPDAFDANGWLQPCLLIKQRGQIPDGWVDDEIEKLESTIQIVELWFYEDSGYEAIDAAMTRCYATLKGHSFADTLPLWLLWLTVSMTVEH